MLAGLAVVVRWRGGAVRGRGRGDAPVAGPVGVVAGRAGAVLVPVRGLVAPAVVVAAAVVAAAPETAARCRAARERPAPRRTGRPVYVPVLRRRGL